MSCTINDLSKKKKTCKIENQNFTQLKEDGLSGEECSPILV